MAHNLNFNAKNNDYSFFSVKERAWHGLGKVVEQYPTSAEAIRYAGLDYTVEKRSMFIHNDEDFFNSETVNSDILIPEIDVPNYYANIRTDTKQVLGVVGKDYQIVQNIDAFEFFDAIVGGGDGILYETAGALGKGERIFITAKLPEYIRVGRDDLIEQYLFLTTSHDGFGSITAAFTPVRVVCNNTLNAALRNHSNAIKIRHTASANERIKQAHTLMGISSSLGNELSELFNYWAKVRITDQDVKKLIQIAMAPNKEVLHNLQQGTLDELSANYTNVIDKVYEYAMGNPTQLEQTTVGTVFGAYNAVTGYFQNVRNYKDTEAKFKSILEGTAKLRAQTAFDLCRDFAVVGTETLNLN
jgi:phage/plasmid-like protein (TIGR03299 family)